MWRPIRFLWPEIAWSNARRRLLQGATAGVLTQSLKPISATADESAKLPPTWTSLYPEQNIWAYADRTSVIAGESFAVMLSTAPRLPVIEGRLEIFPILNEHAREKEPIWRSPTLEVRYHPIGPTAASIGPAWPVALPHIPTSGWAPGLYTADFKFLKTSFGDRDLFQIVVRNSKPSGDILLKLGTNTYQAYNEWGGHSLYPLGDRPEGAMVSFDRPNLPAFLEYDFFLATFLESYASKRGLRIDYCTDFDFHADSGLAEHYRLLATSAHDEYWTKEMFDAVEKRIFKQGGNTIFYGANTAYWQARFADVNRPPDAPQQGRQIVCYKSPNDPIAQRSDDPALYVTSRFRDDARRPESMLTGVAYQSYFSPQQGERRFSYRVPSVDGPLFDGTGWRPGQAVADVVGYEWDCRDPDADGRRLYDPARSRIALLPEDRLHVLFEGQPIDVGGRQGHAEAVMFHSDSGATVFSSGSIRWAWGLSKPGFETAAFRRFNENLLDLMLKR